MAKARRRRRWLVWGCGAGLLLTLSAAGFSELWALSYREPTGGVPSRFVLSQSGILVVYRTAGEDIDWMGRELFAPGWSAPPVARVRVWGRFWAPAVSLDSTGVGTFLNLRLPVWLPALVFGAVLAWGLRGARTGPDVCARCGYDLSGGVGQGCPECGEGVGRG